MAATIGEWEWQEIASEARGVNAVAVEPAA
jgi:hypothetical protein